MLPSNDDGMILSSGFDKQAKNSHDKAGKLIANLIVMGSTIIGRAMLQAYRKALDNANKIGVAHEAMNNIRRASKTMTEQEARQILGVFEQSTWEEIVQRYDNLFERNTKSGSFYLQSKVHRAKECLETVYQKNKQDGTPT
ncbi:mitochondrial import inner membrane translocase subunit PAM16 like 2-like isoform X2 [Phragmites australis]|uniref:mitochondrial import inner membrane translocase subunit PAM16 like 2-like isoform X2 n=1 Tax=Phragmites australis TaxID=29695 RepID=UPI002D78797A|nr:mitochondrial import inner membrane translocase subunit PAM16 like 2-like isoform X2 [Phragmites australis]